MSEMVKTLRERRAKVWEQAKEVADAAAEANRNFSAEEQGKWDVLNEEINQLDARIKSALDTEQRGRDTDEAFNRLHGGKGGKQAGKGGEQRGTGEDADAELRAWMRGETGTRYYEVKPAGRVDWNAIQARALTVGAATGGGDTVPTSFYDRLVEHMIQTPRSSSPGPRSSTPRAARSSRSRRPPPTARRHRHRGRHDPRVRPGLRAGPAGRVQVRRLIQISRELLEDTGVDLEGYLAKQAGRALGNAFGAHAITGNGSSKPRGVILDATLGVTGGSGVGGAFSGDNLIDLFFSVIAPYRNNPAAKWMMADSSIATARKLKDTTASTSGSRAFRPASRTPSSASRSSPSRTWPRSAPRRRACCSAT
jgi:hypothetical protein